MGLSPKGVTDARKLETDSRKSETGAGRPEHRFGTSGPLTIGVEEELLLVDEACGLVAAGEEVLEEIEFKHRDSVSTEIFATQIELKTGICLDAGQAAKELAEVRRAGGGTGARLSGSRAHRVQ